MTLGPLMVDVAGTELTSEDREVLRHPLVGGVILFTRNFESAAQLEALVKELRAVRSPSLLIAVDQEGGRVQRFRTEFTRLPPMRVMGHRYDLDAAAARAEARQCGWLMASELLAVGIDLSFAPVVDLDYGPSTVIGDRAFHRQAEAVADLTIAFVHGMRDAGMAATAKHFPGHGAVAADSHVALPVDRRPRADMEEDLYPYRRLIANGLPSIMMAHVLYEAVDAQPASFSRYWIEKELRGELMFSGAIFSDDLNMEGAGVMGDYPSRVRAALDAGCTMTPLCNNRPGVTAVLDRLPDFSDPAGQARLARLRGRHGLTRTALQTSAEWRAAQGVVLAMTERPPLKLS